MLRAGLGRTASGLVSVRMEVSVTGRPDSVFVEPAGWDSAARKVARGRNLIRFVSNSNKIPSIQYNYV